MQVISVVNTKGGAGKSTIATNIVTRLAQENKKVLLIDTDKKQESAIAFAQIRNENKALADIAVISVPVPSLFKDIRNYANFDYVVIDAGAGDNELVRSAILCSSYGMLLIPVQPAAYDLWATEDTLKLLDSCRNMLPGFDKNYLVMNRMATNDRIKIMGDMRSSIAELCQQYDVSVLSTELHDRIAYKEAICYGMNVVEYAEIKKDAEKAACELQMLADEVLTVLNEQEE